MGRYRSIFVGAPTFAVDDRVAVFLGTRGPAVPHLLGLSQGTVSYHLKQLLEAGVIARETRGTYSYFSLVPGALDAVREVFAG